jgi:hypothetical protein
VEILVVADRFGIQALVSAIMDLDVSVLVAKDSAACCFKDSISLCFLAKAWAKSFKVLF